MVDALGDAARRRPAEALLRAVVRPRELDARRPAARGARAAARPLRVVGAHAARAVRPGRLAHRGADRDRRSFGAYHAANFCLKRADLFPVAICMSGVYDVSVQGGGERGDAVYFNNPMDYVANLDGDHLDWLRAQASLAARLRPGPVGGHDRRARLDQALRLAARREGHPARGRPLGPRRAARLAVVAAADRSSSASVPVMSVTEHTIGLLLGTEEDWPAAFEALVARARPGRRPHAAHRADPQRAVRPSLRSRATRS